jgi:hypothetical protein
VIARRRWIIIVLGAVVALGLAAAALLLATRPAAGYGPDDQAKFTTACATAAGEPVRATCACIYDEITQKVPYDQFVSIDAQLGAERASGQTLELPAPIEAARADCVARAASPPTT